MNIVLRLLWLLVVVAGVSAATLFFLQGGFGGGDGRFDQAIGILGLPWTLIPWPDAVFKVTFIPLVFLPFVINAGFLGTLTALLRKTSGIR
jgi:hypothetical protein